MYFNPFPKTEYTLGSKTESVVDIFRKVAISKYNTESIFTEELVSDADSVESLAEKYYDDADLSWIILLTNDIVDPVTEFCLSTKNFDSLINTKYSGSIFYFEENVQLQQGDILIGLNRAAPFLDPYPLDTLPENLISGDLDTSKYCFVNSYNNEFRYARITNIIGTFTTSTEFAAYRKVNNKLQLITFIKKFTENTEEQNAFVLPIKLIDDYYNAPLYIYNETNQIISPYRRYDGSLGDDYISLESYGSYTSSTDTNAFRSSLLYQGIMSNTNISGLQTKTIIQDLTDKNEKFRKIKILNKQFLVPFIETFNNMISNDDIRFRVISKEN
jgi:hypothetical protein